MDIRPTMEGTPPPDVGGMDDGAGPGSEGGAGQSNPVIGALKTIAAAVAALKERGDPKAGPLMQAFQQLLQAFGAGGQAESPPAGIPPEQAPVEEAPVEGENKPGGRGPAIM